MVYANIGGIIDGIHVTIYSSTMDPMGLVNPKPTSIISIIWGSEAPTEIKRLNGVAHVEEQSQQILFHGLARAPVPRAARSFWRENQQQLPNGTK